MVGIHPFKWTIFQPLNGADFWFFFFLRLNQFAHFCFAQLSSATLFCYSPLLLYFVLLPQVWCALSSAVMGYSTLLWYHLLTSCLISYPSLLSDLLIPGILCSGFATSGLASSLLLTPSACSALPLLFPLLFSPPLTVNWILYRNQNIAHNVSLAQLISPHRKRSILKQRWLTCLSDMT